MILRLSNGENFLFCILLVNLSSSCLCSFPFDFLLLVLQEMMAEGDTVRTIVKFLWHEQSKERDEAVSLLYELSKSEKLCEKMGSINGAILVLVGMSSSKSENLVTVEKAHKTLDNLAKCESNVRQMAENGRLQPLLTFLLEGALLTLIPLCFHKIFCLFILLDCQLFD